MGRPTAQPAERRDPIIGRRVRVRADGEVLRKYEAGPTAPERVSIRIDGIITIVPVACIEVVR